jgi:hypothetical protein
VDVTAAWDSLHAAVATVQGVMCSLAGHGGSQGFSGHGSGAGSSQAVDPLGSPSPGTALHLSLTRVHAGLSVGPTSHPAYGDGGVSVEVVVGGIRLAVAPGRGGHTVAAVVWPFASLAPGGVAMHTASAGPGVLASCIGASAVRISCRCKDLPLSVASLLTHHTSLGLVKASSRLGRRRRHRLARRCLTPPSLPHS